MPGFQPVPTPGIDDIQPLADKLRELSNDVDQFVALHSGDLSRQQCTKCNRASRALSDAFHILIGEDIDARVKAAAAGLDTLKKVTSDAQKTLRKIKRIDTGVKVATALGSVALGIVKKDPDAIKNAVGDLAAALQPGKTDGAPASKPS